jgi:hypothetical protein
MNKIEICLPEETEKKARVLAADLDIPVELVILQTVEIGLKQCGSWLGSIPAQKNKTPATAGV